MILVLSRSQCPQTHQTHNSTWFALTSPCHERIRMNTHHTILEKGFFLCSKVRLITSNLHFPASPEALRSTQNWFSESRQGLLNAAHLSLPLNAAFLQKLIKMLSQVRALSVSGKVPKKSAASATFSHSFVFKIHVLNSKIS